MNYFLMGAVLAGILICGVTSVSAAAISIGSATLSGADATGSVEITLDSAGSGLSGYILSVSPENPQVVAVTGATFPTWATLSEATPGSGAAYTLRALDLNDGVKPGATNVPLATLSLRGVGSGTTSITAAITQMDDDSGNPVDAGIMSGSVTVGGGGGGETGVVNLASGWNLIGIPMTLKPGSDTAEVFRDVPSAGHSIFSYDPAAGWQTIGRTEVLNGMNAYWIYSVQPLTITLQVQGRPTTPRSLGAGWNIASIPGTSPVPAAQALASLSEWTYAIGFDPSLQQYRQPIIRGGSGEHSDQTPLIPGAGYWIYLPSPGQLVP